MTDSTQNKDATTSFCGGHTSSSSSSNDVSVLTSPPEVHETVLERSPESQSEDPHHRPPMSVIVVGQLSQQQEPEPLQHNSRQDHPSASFTSSFSKPFRLQPRNIMSNPGREGSGDAARGRKRSAQTMSTSTLGRDFLLTAKLHPKQEQQQVAAAPSGCAGTPSTHANTEATSVVSTPQRQPATATTTPPRGRWGLGSTVKSFQCLSLQSPKRKNPPLSPPRSLFASPPRHMPLAPQNLSTLPWSSSSSSSSPSKRSALVESSIGSFQSSAAASGNLPPRGSSFTPVYQQHGAASPGGSVRSYGSGSINTRMNISARAASSPSAAGGSAKSSPKIAPLTILKDNCVTKLPQRENQARLPPLPGGGINSLWLSLESCSGSEGSGHLAACDRPTRGAMKDDGSMYPPKTVLCRRASSDSLSTVQNSVMSPIARPSPGGEQNYPSPPQNQPQEPLNTSQSSATNPWTPRSKQMRLNEQASPSQRTGTPRTPLPRVTLTPRSSSSRRGADSAGRDGHGLPRFPSPSDIDIMDVTSPFLSSTAATAAAAAPSSLSQPSPIRDATEKPTEEKEHALGLQRPRTSDAAAIRSLFPGSSNSLALSADGSMNEGHFAGGSKKAPLPVLDLSMKSRRGTKTDEEPTSPVVRHPHGGSFMGIQTRSLLTSNQSSGVLESMIEEHERAMNADLGSVSDIDDDEGFVLASPGVIEAERFASCQPARQRRRRSCDQFLGIDVAAAAAEAVHRSSSPTSSSPNASNSNLAGMNYVPSNTSLFGMDIAHPPESSGVSGTGEVRPQSELAVTTEQTSFPTEKSPSGDYLSTPPSSECHHGKQTLNRRKSDSSFASIGLALDGNVGGDSGGRDLVTPPAMPNPQTPPPLSPKQGLFMPMMTQDNRPHMENHSKTSSVCIAGADRRSVTMAIARMAFESQHHSESSPVL